MFSSLSVIYPWNKSRKGLSIKTRPGQIRSVVGLSQSHATVSVWKKSFENVVGNLYALGQSEFQSLGQGFSIEETKMFI